MRHELAFLDRATNLFRVAIATGLLWAILPALLCAEDEATGPVERQAAAFLESWRWRVFDRDQGLNSNAVTALYQDRHTTKIYAATRLGVCLYDLWHWDVLESTGEPLTEEITDFGQSQAEVYALSTRVLWTVQGGSRLQVAYRGDNLHLASGRLGELFLVDGANRRHFRIRADVRDFVDDEENPVRFPSGQVLDYEIGPDRRHWIATNVRLYSRDLRQIRWKALEDREIDPALSGLVCRRLLRVVGAPPPMRREVDPEVRDELWGCFVPQSEATRQWTLARLTAGVWEDVVAAPSGSLFTRILLDHKGIYHATDEDGQLFQSAAGASWHRVRDLGIGSLAVHAGLIDTAGYFWFRIGAGGIGAFDPESRRWTRVPLGKQGVYPNVLSLIETRSGEIWMGTDKGVIRSGESSPPQMYEDASGVPLAKVTGLAEDAAGRVWASSFVAFKGACAFDGNWSRVAASGFGDEYIAKIVKDWRDELWFLPHQSGVGTGRIYRFSVQTGEKFAPVDLGEAYSTNDLLRTRADVFWLATDRGLLKGRVREASSGPEYRFELERHYTRRDGLLSSAIWTAVEGPDGAIWICYREADSAGGVSRLCDADGVTDCELESFYALEGQGPTWSAITLGDDVWFATDNGLTRFDRECFYSFRVASATRAGSTVWPLFPSLAEPGTLLLGTLGHGAWRFRSDDRIRPRFSDHDLPAEIGPDGNETFAWQAHDYRSQTESEELLYRTRVDGDPWSAFSRDRRRRLEGLAPGDHSFEVEVRDLDGNRSRERLFHRFRVRSLVGAREAWWMVGAVVGGTAVAIFLGYFAARNAARRRERARYRALFRDCPAPVFILDREGRVVDYNGSSPELVGLENEPSENVLGRPLRLLPVFSLKEMADRLKRLLEGEAFSARNYRWLYRGEDERICRVQGFPLAGERGRPTGAVVVLEDRTHIAQEDSLRERESRMRSLRALARQITTGLEQIIDDFQSLMAADEAAAAERRPQIAGRVRRAETIAQSLAAFAGDTGGFSGASPVSINELLERLLHGDENSIENSMTTGARLRVDFRGQVGVWSVRGDEARLSEALIEVLRNATEAMGESGTLTVRTANVRLDEEVGTLGGGAYVEVSIRDTGPGMDAVHREQALEPFFTTKSRDEYLGVGLSLAYGVIRAHGGDLRIESQLGRGTVVRMYLPSA